jgi:metal-responsive CopG/Arc/MetJ family transcriptional regulator
MDEKLLQEVDRDPEAKREGRSAVIRRAVRLYLDLKRRREIDQAYDRAYRNNADEVLAEFVDLLGAQTWPEE